ncbi:hypothetical protein [Emticicia sp. TH156]|uniref:hypothetical protein n=1 Tax=Emticicia sp. TH156 TaxID=2067454 RepID=UPI000C760696|nr:hypothetical protein [Emticicia sp. TH156]PLK43212.1 hypothetical protein C0V77_17725 [Emticicia sp. TH156]
MRRFIAVILFITISLGSLVPKVNWSQSIKLSELVTHYYQHKRDAPKDFNLWVFLVMHYSANSEHAKTKHPSLPSFDINGVSYMYLLPSLLSFSGTAVLSFMSKEDHFNWLNHYFFSVELNLLNPPRA